MSNYKVSNLLSGDEVSDDTEYYYACDDCALVFEWHTETLMRALIHSEKRGHTKGRLSYRTLDETKKQ